MRLAHEADQEDIVAALRTAPHQAMFQLEYLASGFAGSTQRRMSFWVNDGNITDVLAVTNVGMVLPFLPNDLFLGAKLALRGLPISGIIGPQSQVRSLQNVLGLDDAPTLLDQDEPHFVIDLDNLIIPDGPGHLTPLEDAPRDIILDWMEAYQLEALKTPAPIARERAEAGYDNGLRNGNRRVLLWGDVPLALTAYNARLPEIVQIGGVYTPPALRGNGHARRVVALHLAEARRHGVKHAVLSAATDAAARAYRAIGFTQTGNWSFRIFDGPQDHG